VQPVASKITSPRTPAAIAAAGFDAAANLDANPLAQARSQRVNLKRQIAELDAKLAKLGSAASDLQRQAQAVLAAYSEQSAEKILAGEDLLPISREDAELVRKARRVVDSTPAAREKLEDERSELSAQLIKAEAAFAGEVFVYVRQRQRDAQRRITDAFAALAPDFIELLALNEAQRRYCGSQRTMTLKAGEAPPWSGDVVVKNLTERLPLQFKSNAIELLSLTEQSSARVQEVIAEIEGNI
jgi:hypothetical protein